MPINARSGLAAQLNRSNPKLRESNNIWLKYSGNREPKVWSERKSICPWTRHRETPVRSPSRKMSGHKLILIIHPVFLRLSQRLLTFCHFLMQGFQLLLLPCSKLNGCYQLPFNF